MIYFDNSATTMPYDEVIQEVSNGMKEYFESMDWFSSWDTFAIKWDINQDNFLKIIPLKIDPNVEWDETLWSEAKVITGKE